jgi:hypothetical protein
MMPTSEDETDGLGDVHATSPYDILAADHKPVHSSGGDGISSPRESWITCSCGAHIWDWQQFYNETDEEPEVNFGLHLVAEAVKTMPHDTECMVNRSEPSDHRYDDDCDCWKAAYEPRTEPADAHL